jgi:hypothetical protein
MGSSTDAPHQSSSGPVSVFFWPGIISMSSVQIQLDWNFAKRQMIAENPQQITAVVIPERLGFGTHQDNRWWFGRDLSRVVNLGPTILVERWLVSIDGRPNQAIQYTGRNAFSRLLEQHC